MNDDTGLIVIILAFAIAWYIVKLSRRRSGGSGAHDRSRHERYATAYRAQPVPALELPAPPAGRIVAIDFETATKQPHSAISCAIVVVDSMQVVERRHWLIRPPRMIFNPDFIDLHNITPDMVHDQPDFAAIWPELKPYLKGATLLAHNSKFDKSVLAACLKHYQLRGVRTPWICTLDLSRQCWPHLYRHGLPVVCAHLNIPLNHHDAQSDAMAAWLIWRQAYHTFGQVALPSQA
jgi:DNA polymerase-3 subunit epsilon